MKSGKIWPYGIIGALVLNAAGMITLVIISVSNPPRVVAENYYQRAIDWDVESEEHQLFETLGWSLSAKLVETHSGIELHALVRDPQGQPIRGLAVDVIGYQRAFANERHQLTLPPAESPDGVHKASLASQRGGMWQLEFRFPVGSKYARYHVVTTTTPPHKGPRL